MAEQYDTSLVFQDAAEILIQTQAEPSEVPSSLHQVLEDAARSCEERIEEVVERKANISIGEVSVLTGDRSTDMAKYALVFDALSIEDGHRIRLHLPNDTLFDYLELALGAERRSNFATAGRKPTATERCLAQQLAGHFSGSISDTFASLGGEGFRLQDCEIPTEKDISEPSADDLISVSFQLTMLDHQTELLVTMPADLIERVCSALEEPPEQSGDKAGDSWTHHMSEEAMRARIFLTAKLRGGEIMLTDVAKLKPGQILPLDATPDSAIEVECNTIPLIECKIGQAGGAFTLSIEKFLKPANRSNERELAAALGMLGAA